MLNEILTDRVRWMKSRKEALEAELKLVADELAECEGRLKAEQERAAAVEAACRANKFLHDRRTRRLAEYFKDKGLLITSLQETTPLLKTRYKIAKMIYGAQNALVPVLKVLYARKVDEYDLAGLSTDDKTAVCNFLTQLQKIGWLTWSKKGDVVSFKRTIPNEQYVFFNGGWAEEATRYLIEKTLHDLKIPCSKTYREVKVDAIGPEQDVHEFDFIVEFKDRIYIFETKTGSLGVERWIDHARRFNDWPGLNRFLMCCADSGLNAKLFQPYRLFHLGALQAEFGEYLKAEFGVRVAVASEAR